MDTKKAIHICYVCGNQLVVEKVPGTHCIRVRPCPKCNGGQLTDFFKRYFCITRRDYATSQIDVS